MQSMQNVGDIDEQGGSGDHANGVQRSGSGLGRNAPKRGRGRPAGGRGQMRGDMGMGGPMAPVGAGMMGGMQAMPGQMFVLAPGKPHKCSACHLLPHQYFEPWQPTAQCLRVKQDWCDCSVASTDIRSDLRSEIQLQSILNACLEGQ